MPQLDTFTYLSQVTWTLFFFVVFFAIMVTHALPAISRSINVRLKKLSSGGTAAQELTEEEVSVFSSFEKLLSNSFASSRDLIGKTSGSASKWVESTNKEINAVVKRIKDTTQMGPSVAKFEKKVSKIFSKKYIVEYKLD